MPPKGSTITRWCRHCGDEIQLMRGRFDAASKWYHVSRNEPYQQCQLFAAAK